MVDRIDEEHFAGGANLYRGTGPRHLALLVNEAIDAANAANNVVLEESSGSAGPTAGGGAWEDVLSTSIDVLEGEGVEAIATLDPVCSGAGGAFAARVVIGADSGQEIEWDKGASEGEAVTAMNQATGLTAGTITVKVQVKDDASATLTTPHAQIKARAIAA